MAAPPPAPSPALRRRVRRGVAIWVAGSAVGIGILALPDAGPRLVSFSEQHGPTAVDMVGVAALVAAWLPIAWLLWSQRSVLATRPGAVSGWLALAGVVTLCVTIGLDVGASWLLGVVLLIAAQALALATVYRTQLTTREP